MTSRLFARHPVAAMVAITYLVSWCLLPFGTFLPCGPLVAAIVVAAAAGGWGGLRHLGARVVRWRVGWVWYAAAIALPVGAHVLTLLACAAAGAPAPSFAGDTAWSSLLLVAAVRMVDPLDGPLGEEPGWRGFAQPHLQATRSPLRATAILCLAVAGWHLPLYFLPEFGLRPFEAVTTIACTVVYVWLFNRSGGSVLIPLIAHVVEGTVRINDLWPDADDVTRGKVWYAVSWAALAAAVLLLDRGAWRKAPASAQDGAVTPVPSGTGTRSVLSRLS